MARPKLRFKGFNKEWENVSLLSCSELITKGTTPKAFIGGNVNYLKIEAIKDGLFDLDKCQTISQEIHRGELKRSILKNNDLLFAIAGATIGKNAKVKENILPANTNQALAIIRLNSSVDINFVYYVINSDVMTKYINDNVVTGAQPNMNLKQLGDFTFAIPDSEEQTKIANFLTTVDEKISQLNEQHQLMIQYKKGVMQKIFSQEIRFKDDNGEEFGEWEERILEDVSIIIMGSSPKSENYNELGIGLPLLQGNADIKNRKSCPRNFTTEITKECDVGDILMSVRAPVGYVAKAMHDACIGRGIAAIRVKENNNQEFLYQYLIYMEDIWGKFSQGSTFDSVNSEQIKKLSLFIPCLQEQTKIADFLTKLDDKIEKLALQLEQVKTWKKGLLQQMFV